MPTLADVSTLDSSNKEQKFVLAHIVSILAVSRPFANSFFASELLYPEFCSFLFKWLLLKVMSAGLKISNHSLKPEKGPRNGKYTVLKEQDFVAIPYYAWAHRGKREMTMWLNRFAKGEGN